MGDASDLRRQAGRVLEAGAAWRDRDGGAAADVFGSVRTVIDRSATPLDVAGARSLASDLAWHARSLGFAAPHVDVGAGGHGPLALFLPYVAGQMLRFDFRFEALGELVGALPAEASGDPLLVALGGLAAAGRGDGSAGGALDRSAALPDADFRSLHCCLHGWWLAVHLPEQAERLLDLSGRLLADGRPDANAHFRRAYALRRQGIERGDTGLLDLALESMVRAFGDAPPSPDVNQDHVRERELIALARMALGRG